LAINVGGVDYDGCEQSTGNLLEAKANIDHLFGVNDELNEWVDLRMTRDFRWKDKPIKRSPRGALSFGTRWATAD
jgi:hypothetical protein